MLARRLGPVLAFLLTSCDRSPPPVTAPLPSTRTLVVSANPAGVADFHCDGVEDDVEINQAIVTQSAAGGGVVLLEAGTFHVLRSIVVKSNVTLRGAGAGTVIQLQDAAPSFAASAGIIRLKDDAKRGTDKRVQNVTLEDFVVDGNRANQTPTADEKKFGVYSEGDDITMRRILAMNCAGYGFDVHAFADTIPSLRTTIEGCESHGNLLDGFALDMVQNSTCARSYAHDNDRHGFNLITTTARVTVSDCRSLHNAGLGLAAQNGTHAVTIRTSVFADNGDNAIYLRDADSSVVSGNIVRNNVGSGILLRGTDATTVLGNTLTDDSFGSTSYAEIQLDNFLADDASNNLIRSNAISGATAHGGIMEVGLADYDRVESNDIRVGTRHVVLIGPHSTQSGNVLH